MEHLDRSRLEAGLAHLRGAPSDRGRLEMIVVRPRRDERVLLQSCRLTRREGCEGDGWRQRCSDHGEVPDPQTQVTLMNARCVDLVAGSRERWPLAGDQLYVDLDLSHTNLPVGQRLAIGDAVLEVTAEPHTGCAKFAARYGAEALKFVNKGEGADLNLRGIYAMVVEEGEVSVGDVIEKR